MAVIWQEFKDWARPIRRRYFPETIVRLLRRELAGMESVVDLGCGSDSRLQFVMGIPRKVGVDAFGPSIEKARAKGIHHEYVLGTLDSVQLPEKGFDVVMAMDLIEHFEKAESIAFVEKAERLARKKVILFTPNGFLPQAPFEGNPWQEHKCGWDTADFTSRGYRVEGVLGFKWLRGESHSPRIRPQYLGEKIANTTRHLYTRWHPESDAALLAVKELP